MFLKRKRNFVRIFACLGLLGVVLGAFGAHALKTKVHENFLENWKTATLYLFVHVLVGLFAVQFASRLRSAYLFLTGILFFSGSLYAMVLTGQTALGIITPIGGVLLILGWFMLVFDVRTS